jgi:hypothetical protein
MRVVMEIRRSGERYEGSLTRISEGAAGADVSVPFAGILELLAALERLESDDRESGGGGGSQ